MRRVFPLKYIVYDFLIGMTLILERFSFQFLTYILKSIDDTQYPWYNPFNTQNSCDVLSISDIEFLYNSLMARVEILNIIVTYSE